MSKIIQTKTQEEAINFIECTKKRYWDASHTVWCYSIRGDGVVRFSDDGEPQGTAGLPALEVLQKEGITDCALTITRYFGGTLLGTGGLARAYAGAARAALEAAGVAVVMLCRELKMTLPYPLFARLEGYITQSGAAVLHTNYAEAIEILMRLPAENAERFCAGAVELSNGKIVLETVNECFAEM